MDSSQLKNNIIRKKRALRVRKSLRGDRDCPRLSVIKSGRHVYVQLIDDVNAVTLASTSTISKEFRKSEFNQKNQESAKQLGLKIAELAKGKNVTCAVFDRGPFKYHGIIASVAAGAREGGLQF